MYESGENYLETVLILQKEHDVVRSIDIARKLGVSKPSVSRAMGLLRQAGYIEMPENGPVFLTEKGRAEAERIYSRHCGLTSFLEKITGVSRAQAEENACRIEHIIDDDVFQGILNYMHTTLK
ncbi:metal-dependent transcriptional regulator [Treponema brennaborense]|uniref:Transcriptional regulator MntR n=1 Tax=Treponema brennaborense (strain DSM 12168 / CIP 105900 / DD5/3) TaxID=906968 RepID=F4LJL7_TREBD|nr:metal-dependent transcriptional regulator [Treponema brennaborense]AEE16412.1 iron (metal) dependent repressor, DtxR family [Treponema brennaborense DSM 12168]